MVELTAGIFVEIEQRRDGGHHPRLGADAGQVVLAEVEGAQQGLVEQSRKAVVDPMLAEAPHEVFDGDAVELERLKQQGQLHDALALLDETQIGGGDLETARDLALLKAPP